MATVVMAPAWWENPFAWIAQKLGGTASAAITGQITREDYLRIRQELINGMRHAGAKEWQITQAIAEFDRQVMAQGGIAEDVVKEKLAWGFGGIVFVGLLVGGVYLYSLRRGSN